MAVNRSVGRDVHIYDAKNPDIILGGLILTSGVTNANLHAMIDIFCIFAVSYILQGEDRKVILRDDNALRPGKYFIVTEGIYFPTQFYRQDITEYEYLGLVTISNEPWLVRTISVATGSRIGSFRDSVRERDRRCVITGHDVLARQGNWTSYDAAHIFPLAYQAHWTQYNFGRWINIAPESGSTINSVQNGLLLRSHIHALFDNYHLSINPDVIFFDRKLQALNAN